MLKAGREMLFSEGPLLLRLRPDSRLYFGSDGEAGDKTRYMSLIFAEL